MAASSVEDFDERLNSADCPSHVRSIVGALRAHIVSCGPVNWRAHRSTSGWGLRAAVGGRIVCRMDPKPVGGYVGVQVMDAEPGEYAAAGRVNLRKNAPSWVHVATPEAAAALFPLISRAYITAQARATRMRSAARGRRFSARSRSIKSRGIYLRRIVAGPTVTHPAAQPSARCPLWQSRSPQHLIYSLPAHPPARAAELAGLPPTSPSVDRKARAASRTA